MRLQYNQNIAGPARGNEKVVAFVQLLPGSALELAELMQFPAAQFTSYKRACEVVVRVALPAASTGIILKHRLWETAQAAQVRAGARTVAWASEAKRSGLP